MDESNNFDLKKFQSEVIENYCLLKKMDERVVQSEAKKPSVNFIWKGFIKIMGAIEKKALQDFSAKPDIIEYTKRAGKIVSQSAVKKILCASLAHATTENLLDVEIEIRTVKILTSLLLSEQIAKKFWIDSDAHLFAFMTREILRQGVEKYCGQD